MSIGSAYTVLTEKWKWSKLSAVWASELLGLYQLQIRAELSVEIWSTCNQDPEVFLGRIVTDKYPFTRMFQKGKTLSKQWLPTGGSGPGKAKAKQEKDHSSRLLGLVRAFCLLTFCLLRESFEKMSQSFSREVPRTVWSESPSPQ